MITDESLAGIYQISRNLLTQALEAAILIISRTLIIHYHGLVKMRNSDV